ncbi:hypothetical protein [Janibacter melonis]|uniref:hypothetical protein n=1 Tax=Janibacter melonis TaxID=262209 RepID=UPI0027DA92C8|nr:hypothetical protein [Janibacter melonis]
MSKSKGNLVRVSDLRREGVDPAAIRLVLLAHHYRTEWSWTEDSLRQAQRRLDRWRRATSLPSGPGVGTLADEVRTARRRHRHRGRARRGRPLVRAGGGRRGR